ncbi:hypothetical protein O1L60_24145 [Streptomyces diastatochromogenes]|nr:hypothetical protein [Streptomyces diastatochromogenes]
MYRSAQAATSPSGVCAAKNRTTSAPRLRATRRSTRWWTCSSVASGAKRGQDAATGPRSSSKSTSRAPPCSGTGPVCTMIIVVACRNPARSIGARHAAATSSSRTYAKRYGRWPCASSAYPASASGSTAPWASTWLLPRECR